MTGVQTCALPIYRGRGRQCCRGLVQRAADQTRDADLEKEGGLPLLFLPPFLNRCAAFRRQGMRGVRPRAAGPFSDARKGTKSAHKGDTPLCNPQRGARLWLGGNDTHVSARLNLFFVQTGPVRSPQAVPQNPTTQCSIGPSSPASLVRRSVRTL